MKTEHPDVVPAHEETPEGYRAFVQSRQAGPSEAAFARMANRLTAAGVLGQSPSTKRDGLPSNGKVVAYYKPVLLAFALAGTFALLRNQVDSAHFGANGQASSVTVDRPALDISSTPSPPPVENVAAEIDSPPALGRTAPVVSVEQLPSVPAVARASGSASSGSAAARRAKSAVTTGAPAPSPTELELIQRAQQALASNPSRGLALTDEHARTYPNGELLQEREVIAVEALSRMGRSEEAARRANALVQRFPETPYAARLAVALGRPLPEPSGTSLPPPKARSLSTP